MKTSINLVLLLLTFICSQAQITFNGCHPLFENQDYVFNLVDTDATGRNTYTTVPVDGEQACGGIGTCEFMIIWNDSSSEWEFLADDGNGDFSAPFLVYSNTSASTPNPPSLSLGTWVENNAVTLGDCGGNLSADNATLIGDVQDEALGIEQAFLENKIRIYPNPVSKTIHIITNKKIDEVKLYNVQGRMVLTKLESLEKMDVSHLYSGIYFLKLKSKDSYSVKKVIIKR